MKYSNYFIPTKKENPSDCVYVSQSLMYRSGMLTKVSNGLFVYQPVFLRVLDKVKRIIDEEMAAVNSMPVKFPILVSKDTLDASGRWDAFGKEMFKLKDRNGNDYAISPTNEEAACFIAKTYVESYRDLPFSIYQIQQKHRDEICPRGGVMRAREFIMKDAYSFHADSESLDEYYDGMRAAYIRIFNRMGLSVIPVLADTGAMGGNGSQEVMALSDKGEAEIAVCDKCGYAANLETVPCVSDKESAPCEVKNKYKKVYTPHMKTINDVAEFFKTEKTAFVKSIFYTAATESDGEKKTFDVVVLARGDREINEVKLRKYLKVSEVALSDKAYIEEKYDTIIGFVGPVGLKCRIVADEEVRGMRDYIVGANERDYHLSGVNPSDFTCEYTDLRFAEDGDKCPCCGAPLNIRMGNEVGHIFKLGTRYTKKLNLTYVNSKQENELMIMGCYGIGLERSVASIIDQNHDDDGIIWPVAVAPFTVVLVTVDTKNELQVEKSKVIYEALRKEGVEVLWDDRPERAGFKFKDADLIGFPIRIVVGKKIADGIVEVKQRRSGKVDEIAYDKCVGLVKDIASTLYAENK